MLYWDHFRDRFLDHFTSKSNLKASVLAAYNRGIDLMIVWSVFLVSESVTPKLPMYVFKRANGSYRYKRNVPKDLREVIAKATVYRQLGNT